MSDTLQLRALSISRPVLPWSRRDGLVLAVFDRACQLQTSSGDVVALVLPQIGDGPLNVVVEAEAGVFAGLNPGMPAHFDRSSVQVGSLEVALHGAEIWEPLPDWPALRALCQDLQPLLAVVRALALTLAPVDSLLAMLYEGPHPGLSLQARTALAVARQAAAALKQGWTGEESLLSTAGSQLAGLGGGLTPAGDDFLIGVMLWSWLVHTQPRRLCAAVVETAAPRTTTLSAAFLRAAARGQCGHPWHRLLQALATRNRQELEAATAGILAYGQTSGADALAGFLWLAQA